MIEVDCTPSNSRRWRRGDERSRRSLRDHGDASNSEEPVCHEGDCCSASADSANKLASPEHSVALGLLVRLLRTFSRDVA